MDVVAEIRKRYPQLAYLFNDPEVGPLLRDAVDPSKGFSPDEFQARLYGTNWFKRQSTAQRQWDILSNTDPATANAKRGSTRTEIMRLASRLGIQLSGGEINVIAEGALQRGWDPTGPEMLEHLTTYGRKINRYGPGAIRTAANTARQLSKSQYYTEMSTSDAMRWGDWMARGLKTEADLQQELQSRAMSRYRHLAPMLGQGKTMEDIFGGHRSLIAQELEISPESIDFTRGPFTKVIGFRDPKAEFGSRPLSLYETQTLARSQDQWWQTSNGRSADASMADMMLKVLGKRK